MNALKKIDLTGQLWLIISWGIMLLIPLTRTMALVGYFIIGGWQLTSALIHRYHQDKLLLFKQRNYYNNSLIAVLMIGLLCFVFPVITFIYLFALLFASPIMAIWYLVISYREWETWKAKAWVHLK